MKPLLYFLSLIALTACGGAPSSSSDGGSAPGTVAVTSPSPTPSASPTGPATHVYEMQVVGSSLVSTFTFAPAIIGGSTQFDPGLETVASGATVTYQITDTQADFQITGNSDPENNANFTVTVNVLEDGVEKVSWTIAPGISEEIQL